MSTPVRCADGIERASLGQFNAYVGAGGTPDVRRARLAEVPPEWRDLVRAHVEWTIAMRRERRAKS